VRKRFRALQINRKQLSLLFTLLLIAVSVRVLTLQFMRAHLNDPAWFQTGTYAKFDGQARDILDGQKLFWIDDPTRTDLVRYPPAFPVLVALIYKLTGDHSAYSVQLVLWFLDLILSLLLIAGIAFTVFGQRAAIAAGFLVALSPLFAMYAAFPSPDAPTTWFVLAGNWLLILAAQRKSVRLAFASGVALGIACWLRVNPLYLCVGWAVALLLVKAAWSIRFKLAAAALAGTILLIAPIVIRNYLVFPDFTPTGVTIGVNLWEGLGETELGQQHGFILGDDKMLAVERERMGWPADMPVNSHWPDGIRRDRERMRERAYADPQARKQLESIIHPLVGQESARQVQAALDAGARCIVFDIPLLVESGRWRAQVDRVLVVDCSAETQVERVVARSGLTPEAVRAIIAAQATRRQRLAAADIVICNEGLTLDQLRDNVVQVARRFGL